MNLVSPLLRTLFRSWRIDATLPDGSEMPARSYAFDGKLFALSERDAIALAGVIVDRGFSVLAAHGRDGALASAALRAIGCRVVRGSAGRGGAAALRRLGAIFGESDAPGGIVVDGPLGPPDRPKPGILWWARETGRGIVPLGAASRPALVFRRSWSGVYLPPPFARIRVVVAETLRVPPHAADAELPSLGAELGRRMRAAREAAIARLAGARRPREVPLAARGGA